MFSHSNAPYKYLDRTTSISMREIDSLKHGPHISIISNVNLLPTFSATLSRTGEEYLLAEDLDNLQLELENLLSSAALRYRVLKCEIDLLDKDEKRFERKPKLYEKQPSSPGRKKRDDMRKSKTINKLNKLRYSPGYYPIHHTDSTADIGNQATNPAREKKTVLPKNDLPNKFWLSVEPFCMPLTNEDLKLLDILIEQYSGPLVPPVPDLGQHFSTNISEDMLCSTNTSRSKFMDFRTNIQTIDTNVDKYVTGPLTQRLMSALIEDNFKIEFSNHENWKSSENVPFSNLPLKSYSIMKNGVEIEKRLTTELIQQSMFDEDISKNDEILSEIKRLISEISLLSEYNAGALRKLRDATYCEINRLGIKLKLDSTDHEILDVYKKMNLSKSKYKSFSTLEKQEISRLMSEQKILSEKLEISYKL